jgi:histidinol-phosphate aminotransferase
MEFKSLVNPRIFDVPDYDQHHVTQCWEDASIHRAMSNESNYPPIPAVQLAIIEAASKANYYAEDPSYAMALRTKLAVYSSVRPENITLGNGSIELLDLLFQVFIAKPGEDECVLVNPDYSAYTPRIKFFGGVIKYAQTDANFMPKADAIISQITPKTKFVLFSRPNNPIGTVMPEEEVRRILETGVVTFVDEAYVEMADDGTSVSSWLSEYDNLVVLRTFSKGFSLAGVRLGYVIAHTELIRYLNRSRHIFNVNLAAMAAGNAALDHLEEVRVIFKKLAETRDWMTKEIEKIPGLKPIPSKGNFVMINVQETGRTGTDFVNHLMEKGYMVRDFSKKGGLAPGAHFRISVGLPEDMKNLLGEIKLYLNQ